MRICLKIFQDFPDIFWLNNLLVSLDRPRSFVKEQKYLTRHIEKFCPLHNKLVLGWKLNRETKVFLCKHSFFIVCFVSDLQYAYDFSNFSYVLCLQYP